MTISTFAKDGPYAGDGSANQAFTITFEFFDTSEVVATTRVTATGVEATLVETTNYTINGTGSSPYTGGTLTLATGTTIESTSTLTISRVSTKTQATDLTASGTLPADTLEDQYDKIVMWLQEHDELLGRCLKIPVTDGAAQEAATELGNAVDRADCNLTFGSDGSPAATALVTPTDASVTAKGAELLDDATFAAMRATLGLRIAVNVQGYNVNLAALAGVVSAANKIPYFTGSGTAASLNFFDEDDMASNGATAVASQQSTKAYVDALAGYKDRGSAGSTDIDLTAVTADGTWQDIDLSGGISVSGAVVVCCHVQLLDDVAGTTIEFRTNGYAGEKNISKLVAPAANIGARADIILLTDSDQKIEALITSGATLTGGHLTVKGWWLAR